MSRVRVVDWLKALFFLRSSMMAWVRILPHQASSLNENITFQVGTRTEVFGQEFSNFCSVLLEQEPISALSLIELIQKAEWWPHITLPSRRANSNFRPRQNL